MSENQLAVVKPPAPGRELQQIVAPFSGLEQFEAAQRMARALCTSDLVPEIYRGEDKIGNALIALELSNRLGASPLMIMQNMSVIEGRPSWSSQFLIGAVNASRRFTPVRFRVRDIGPKKVDAVVWEGPKGNRQRREVKLDINDRGCVAWAKDLSSGDELESPEVTLEMAIKEGWYTRNGSKWQTMPDLMLRYRAAAFFSRLYAPEISLGMMSQEEAFDVSKGSAIEVDTVPVDDDGSVDLPKRQVRAPRPANATVVDAGTPPPAAQTTAATPPPAAAATAEPPAKPKGLPRRQTPAPPAAAATPPPPPAKESEVPFIVGWMNEHKIMVPELQQALSEYVSDVVIDNVLQLPKEHLEFVKQNAQALADSIKGARVV